MLMVPPAAVLPAGWPLVPGAVDSPPPRLLHAENATTAMAARAPRRRSGLLDLLTMLLLVSRRFAEWAIRAERVPASRCPSVEVAARSRMMRHRGKGREG